MRNKKISILDLISIGQLHVGQTLVWNRRSLGETQTAVIQLDGTLKTADGAIHKTPSGAAKHFTKKPIDGWHVWKVKTFSTNIGSLRKTFSE